MTLQEALLDGRVVWFPSDEDRKEALLFLEEDPRFVLSPLLKMYAGLKAASSDILDWYCVYCKDLVSHMGEKFRHTNPNQKTFTLYGVDCYANQPRTSYRDLVPVYSEPSDLTPDLDLSTLLGGEPS